MTDDIILNRVRTTIHNVLRRLDDKLFTEFPAKNKDLMQAQAELGAAIEHLDRGIASLKEGKWQQRPTPSDTGSPAS